MRIIGHDGIPALGKVSADDPVIAADNFATQFLILFPLRQRFRFEGTGKSRRGSTGIGNQVFGSKLKGPPEGVIVFQEVPGKEFLSYERIQREVWRMRVEPVERFYLLGAE